MINLPTTKLKAQQGLSLLEVILSIALVVIAVTALVVITNAAISSVNSARNEAVADQYVRQALEAIRVSRDTHGWNEFLISNPAPSSGPTLPVLEVRVFSLSGTDLKYQSAISQPDAEKNACAVPALSTNADYLIPQSSNLRQVIYLNRLSATEVQVTATVCYGLTKGIYTPLREQIILTNWQ